MGQFLYLFVPLLVGIFTARQYINLCRNIKVAKTINLPYIIVPVYTGKLRWFIIAPYVIPFLRYVLPSFINRKWINLLHPYWTWYEEYKPFQENGSDTIVTVAPGGITFHTCCPEFIRQVGDRRKDFQKPLELYHILNTFGPNVVSTNGPLWRHQRKIMVPSFNDAHNAVIWSETIFQASSMLQVWSHQLQALSPKNSMDFQDQTRTLAFNVIHRSAFGVRIPYPGSAIEETSDEEGAIHSTILQRGHTMDFSSATFAVVDGLKWLFIFPRWSLRYSPFGYLRHVWRGFLEMGTYLDGYITNKQFKGPVDEGISMEKDGEQNSLIENNMKFSSDGGLVGLTKQQIIGNVFNSLTAGHETTGSTLFNSMVNLALHPTWQRKVQADIDTIFGDTEPSEWVYKEGLDKLIKSSLDATVLETLRVYPPNNLVPKHSVERSGPAVTLKHCDVEVNVPADSRVLVLMASTHRNSNYWPHSSSTSSSGTDMGEFKPERWFVTPFEAESVGGRSLPFHPLFANTPEAQAGKGFLKPERGAFIPWSIGQRECIGKQFAHTELLVALAVIFREWSVELVVDNASGNVAEKGAAWEFARDKAKKNMRDGMTHYATMQLGRGLVPLRVVKRVR